MNENRDVRNKMLAEKVIKGLVLCQDLAQVKMRYSSN